MRIPLRVLSAFGTAPLRASARNFGLSRAVGVVTSTTETKPEEIALDGPLLTADEVAALLSVPRSSVYEYARRRHRPAAVAADRPAPPIRPPHGRALARRAGRSPR